MRLRTAQHLSTQLASPLSACEEIVVSEEGGKRDRGGRVFKREGGRVLTVAAVSLGYGVKVGKIASVLRTAQHLLTPLASRLFFCW